MPIISPFMFRYLWLRDESLEDSKNIPVPDIIAKDIAENYSYKHCTFFSPLLPLLLAI